MSYLSGLADELVREHAEQHEGMRELSERLFTRGYTTRQDGQGLGLHSSALAAKTLGASSRWRAMGLERGPRPRWSCRWRRRSSGVDSFVFSRLTSLLCLSP